MSGAEVLDALLGPSLARDRAEGDLIEVYVGRLLGFGTARTYAYLHRERETILHALGKANRRASFVLSAWQLAPAEDWADWAAAMPTGQKAQDLTDEAAKVLAHMLGGSGELETEAIRSVPGHFEALGTSLSSLAGDPAPTELIDAAGEALGQREWWSLAAALDPQVALHEVLRAAQRLTPKLSAAGEGHPLESVRFADIERAPLDSPFALSGMRELAVDLSVGNYAELWQRIPKADPEEQPALFAERVLSRVILERRERGPGAGRNLVAAYMKEIRALRELGSEYRSQSRQAATAMIDLQPAPTQMRTLGWYLGSSPGEEALGAARRWAERADRKRVSETLVRMIYAEFDATEWARALSSVPYTEAPVLRKLSEKLLQRGTKVRERERMSRIARTLQLRTQNGTEQLAGLITRLLAARRPKEDLRVALVLCEGLGPDHEHQAKLRRSLIAYAKRHSHRFTPAEVRAIAATGVELPGRYLSKNAAKRAEDLVAEGRQKFAGLRKLVGLG
jgi:hypothetical protein